MANHFRNKLSPNKIIIEFQKSIYTKIVALIVHHAIIEHEKSPKESAKQTYI